MTVLDVEATVRAALTSTAAALPDHPDPWQRYLRGRRAHRRASWARRGAAALALAAAVAAVMLNVVPIPSIVPVVPVGPASSGSLLWSEPPSGSLASDEAWLTGLRSGVADVAETEGTWRVAGRDRIHVVFAGDVGQRRVALVVVPLRLGVIETWDAQWYDGERGAVPAEMLKGANFGELPDVVSLMSGNDSGGQVLVLAPRGSMVEVSAAAEFGADGRIGRTWTPADVDSGAQVGVLPAGTRPGTVAVRVRRAGATLMQGTPTTGTWDGDSAVAAPVLPPGLETRALAQARGQDLDPEMARSWIQVVLEQTGIDPADAAVRIPWTGEVAGRRAALVTVQPAGGGVVVCAFRGSATTTYEDLRLLVPAAGAVTRPIAYRLRAVGDDRPAGDIHTATVPVVVVAPPGASTAELVVDGVGQPVDLRPDGSAELRAPRQAALSVRAFDSSGTLLGETPVAPLTDSSAGLPGEDRATRLVD